MQSDSNQASMFVIIVFYYIDHPCISSAEHFVLKPKLQITIMAVDAPTLQLQRMRALLASRKPTLGHLKRAHFTKTQIDGEKAKKKVDMMKQTAGFYMRVGARKRVSSLSGTMLIRFSQLCSQLAFVMICLGQKITSSFSRMEKIRPI